MRRALLGAVLAGATVAGAAPARAADVGVGIPSRQFSPATVEVLVGDTVTWRNGDMTTHDIVADDGSFTSGLLPMGASFTQAFAAAGAFRYSCSIHPEMRGEVDVVPVALDGPGVTPTAGERFTLRGRAPAGAASVALERAPGADGPYTPVASVAPDAGGAFSATLPAEATGWWRATVGAQASPPVRVAVAPAVAVSVRVRRGRRLTVLRVRTTPRRPYGKVVLERYARWHFIWRRSERATLDGSGRISFTLEPGDHGRARVAFLPEGAGAPVLSPAVRIGRSAAPPAAAPGTRT